MTTIDKPFTLLQLRTGEDEPSDLYPVPAAKSNTVEAEPGDGPAANQLRVAVTLGAALGAAVNRPLNVTAERRISACLTASSCPAGG